MNNTLIGNFANTKVPDKQFKDNANSVKVSIKIHRDRKNDNSFHNGIIEFDDSLQIPFQVSDGKLKEIHYESIY
jgi:hypothetical protein